MRLSPLYLLPSTLISALHLPNLNTLHTFLTSWTPTLSDYIPPPTQQHTNFTCPYQPPEHDLLKRQFSNTCPTNFRACNNLGAPGLCCASAAICSPDANGNVACCPSGAACSGTINGVITAGTVNSDGGLVSQTSRFVYGGSTTTQGGGGGLVPASPPTTVSSQQRGSQTPQGSGGGFIIDGTSTVASPGVGGRAADVPLLAKVVIRALEYLPVR